MFTIKVIESNSGKPVNGARVQVSLGGIWTGGLTEKQYTDSNGDAHFDSKPGSGEVFVDGKTVHKGQIAGRVIVYV